MKRYAYLVLMLCLGTSIKCSDTVPQAIFLDDNIDRFKGKVAEGMNIHALFYGQDSYFEPLISTATRFGAVKIISYIIEQDKALLTARDEIGRMPLHHAAASNRLEAATTLIELGALTTDTDYAGNLPVHWAQIQTPYYKAIGIKDSIKRNAALITLLSMIPEDAITPPYMVIAFPAHMRLFPALQQCTLAGVIRTRPACLSYATAS
ncbi:MAG: hypothetical protein QG604_840 [Candidatus Dependentiae bacterium]|nr:hypothetical protein [Candidatus Dependentiae bacterium]